MKIFDNIPIEGFAYKVDTTRKTKEGTNIADHIQRRYEILCSKYR